MADVQIGTMVYAASREPRPDTYHNSVKHEDQDKWDLPDLFLARGIADVTVNNPKGQILLVDLVGRLNRLLHLEEAYLMEAVLKLLRSPPTGPTGVIEGLSFRQER